MTLPLTPLQEQVRREYCEACERLANASVVKHRADANFAVALTQYNKAHNAALHLKVLGND